MFDGLTNQHPVERISMQCRKLVEVKHGSFVEWQRFYSVALTLLFDKTIKRAGERQLAERMLNREFPDRHDAQQHFIRRIGE